MAKNDNAHAVRMIDSLRHTVGEDAAKALDVTVRLLESIKTGGTRCAIEVEW